MATTRFAYTNRLESSSSVLLNGPAVVTGVINQWTNGSALVTRASGSYITDGIKPWSLVSGNLAAKFPASTRVASVDSATQLTLTANATAGGSGTDSATFTPDRALEQDANYPMTNAQNGQRYIPWKSSGSPPGTVIVEYDLGSVLNCEIAAAFNLNMGLGISAIEIQYASVYGTWTSAVTFNPAQRVNAGSGFTNVARRFWRFILTVTGPFTVGKLWLGLMQQDMGVQFSPGTVRGHRKNRSTSQSGAGLRQSFYHSRNLHQWSLAYDQIPTADRTKLDTVFLQQKSIVLIDQDDAFHEAESTEEAWGASEIFTAVYSSRLVLEELV